MDKIYIKIGTEKSCIGILPVRPLDERSLWNENTSVIILKIKVERT